MTTVEFSSFKDKLFLASVLFPLVLGAFDLKKIDSGKSFEKEISNEIKNSKNNFYRYMKAIAKVESNYDHKAINKQDGKAYGLFQFRKIAIDDINKRYKTNYTINDAFDPQKSVVMFTLYNKMLVNYYKYYNKVKTPTYKDLAMMYHGGLLATRPNNKLHKQAERYANKVIAEMNK